MKHVSWFSLMLLVAASTACIEEYGYQHAKKPGEGEPREVKAELAEEDLSTDAGPIDDLFPADACVPDCQDKNCGDNGCSGTCGKCGNNAICSNKGKCICPNEGCMGVCCGYAQVCGANGKCCTPDCDGRVCGNNGCGGSCGLCPANEDCTEGQCDCNNLVCANTCCPPGAICQNNKTCCVPDCTGMECGDDGCGGECGLCPDDGNLCTTDKCEEGQCTVENNSKSCDDLDPCTIGDVCAEAICAGTQKCDDLTFCTADSCSEGNCTYDPAPMDGLACDDGNPCTEAPVCTGGLCHGELLLPDEVAVQDCVCYADEDCQPLENGDICDGTLRCLKEGEEAGPGVCDIDPATVLTGTCDDTDLCTIDSCVPETGCHFEPVPCDDEHPCTTDSCNEADGLCLHDPVHDLCDDSKVCTSNICSPDVGCTFEAIEGSCDDGNPCTDGDFCQMGECQSGAGTLSCQDAHDCTTDTCDPDSGCVNTPVDLACDDSIECTVDSCDPVGGCINAPTNSLCDDALFCTGTSVCEALSGCVHSLPPAVDGIDCTVDTCDEALESVGNTPDPTLCLYDGVKDAACVTAVCDAQSGCLFEDNDGAECDDSQLCTKGDSCSEGYCVPGAGTDSDPSCTGCTLDDDCPDDLNPCNGTLKCVAGDCVAIPDSAVQCPPHPFSCMKSVCDPGTGLCQETPSLAGSNCDDGDGCTTGDQCDGSGNCVGYGNACDDVDPCTEDTCLPEGKCTFVHIC